MSKAKDVTQNSQENEDEETSVEHGEPVTQDTQEIESSDTASDLERQ